MNRWAQRAAIAGVAALSAVGITVGLTKVWSNRSVPRADAAVALEQGPSSYQTAEVVFERGLKNGWKDFGWCQRQVNTGGSATLHLNDWGGWIIAKPSQQPGVWGSLVFHVKAPPSFGDFLEVRVDTAAKTVFPRLRITNQFRRVLPDGWHEINLPLHSLNPEGLPFDRIVIRAIKRVGAEPVLLDHILFTKGSSAPAASAQPASARAVRMTVNCSAAATPIHPTIYGIAYHFRRDAKHKHQWTVGATARRWGGNPASRYNWRLGNAWNTASDWYFENVNYTGDASFSYRNFLRDNEVHQVESVLTVPILGWVARNTSSVSFPVSLFGKQQSTDPHRPEAGNGKKSNGDLLTPGPETRTSIEAPPSMIADWVKTIREHDKRSGKRSVHAYILGNEPMLWNSTHRDVHPDPVGYDELLDRLIRYGTAIRRADPDATIAGPALWGWPAYSYSAKDEKMGFRLRPDRRLHGDKPLLPWLLEKLADHERSTGVRILDLVDVHFYPQAKRVGTKQGGIDRATAALRIRSTRALWDPSYVDESWIKQPVNLIPRLKEWIAHNYPGRGISIGEYNFGAEQHISGGLAVAEALGRYGQLGVASAYYWTYPPEDSPAYWAFRAYRNFDGNGGRFLDWSIPTQAATDTSLFASRDGSKQRLVLVALNTDPDREADATIEIGTCGSSVSYRVHSYTGGTGGFVSGNAETTATQRIKAKLPPYSINVVEIQLRPGSR